MPLVLELSLRKRSTWMTTRVQHLVSRGINILIASKVALYYLFTSSKSTYFPKGGVIQVWDAARTLL